MERTLVLLRHGKSDWDGDEPDRDRPLAPRGVREAAEAGRWLAGHQPDLALAVVSPAQRTLSTWQLVATELPNAVPTQVDERIYAAAVDDLLAVVRDLRPDTPSALVVGHNPGLEELVRALTGKVIPMPTSALAVLHVGSPWGELDRAVLQTSGRPPSPSA